MLDIHTHLLHGMDDGSRSLEQSLAMLREMTRQGVDTVALTPHYEAGYESPSEFVRRRAQAERQLRLALTNAGKVPKLIAGAEVAFFEGMSHVEDLDALCIEGTGSILLEMPFSVWSRRMLNEIKVLQQVRGMEIILAHIERYRSFQPTSVFAELSENGVWLQCNTSFFMKWQTYLPAMSMLKRRLVHFVASDCHDLESRPPNLGSAMEEIRKRFGGGATELLTYGEEMLWGG